MKKRIKEFLAELRPEFNFESSDDYISDGLLDSFDIVSLCGMLEEEYEIKIDGLDITPENFCNVDAIETLVKKTKGSSER